jgi:UMF1 family MFS transporter
MKNLKKDDKNVIRAWTFYDWANSSFPLVINSAIFPTFYEAKTTIRNEQTQEVINDKVIVFGFEFVNTAFYSYVVSFALIIVALLIPVLSGIADYSGSKKKFLRFFCILGSVSCAGLYFFDTNNIFLSMLPFMFATIGYWSSIVFYNAYLPEIASHSQQDSVSAKGFAMGYLGSSILLIINLVLIIGKIMPAQWSFVSVALWWLIFAQIPLKKLPSNIYQKKGKGNVLSKGFKEIQTVWKQLKTQVKLKRFLISYFFYNMGVQTVMYLATLFAAHEIEWPDAESRKTSLIISILLIQFLGIAGSFLFSKISSYMGNLKALGIAIVIWIHICTFVYFVVRLPFHFYITAACVGLVMGGIQALSRSTYSKLLPETEDHTSYFSFFDVLEKVGIVLGTLTFGILNGISGNMRSSVLSLIVYFIIGLLFLISVGKVNFKSNDR